MSSEKAQALVLRGTDFSETSRVVTLWSREFGKVRVLAKGGRRLRSAFENALDLLTLCDIVFIRKSSGSLDLLTEARVVRRFPRLAARLPALYGAYYVAELLSDWTEDYDPHPALFDAAVAALTDLEDSQAAPRPELVVMRFEMRLLSELGYAPALDVCACCGAGLTRARERGLAALSVSAGGLLCGTCAPRHHDHHVLAAAVVRHLEILGDPGEGWRDLEATTDETLRKLLDQYVTYRLGRRPRMASYLERGS